MPVADQIDFVADDAIDFVPDKEFTGPSVIETAIPGVFSDMASGEGPGAFDVAMQPIVELPAVPAKFMQGILSPMLPGQMGAQIGEGAGRFVSKAASSLLSPGMMVLGGIGAVAPPVAGAVIASMGAAGLGPAAVEALEASKRGDVAGFTESALDAGMAGLMASGGARGVARAVLPAPKPPILPIIEQAKQNNAPLTAAALKTVADKGETIAIESIPGVEKPPVPETEATTQSQMQMLAEGKRKAVLITAGEQIPTIPQGMDSLPTLVGTFIFDPAKVTRQQIEGAVFENRVGDVLDYGIPAKPTPGTEVGAVVVRAADGTEKQAVVTDQANLPSVTAAADAVKGPGDTVAIETAEQVIAGRQSEPPPPQPSTPSTGLGESPIGSRPGPMLTPTAVAPAPQPKKLSQIIRDLSTGLATPIRFGRLLSKKFGGYFMPKQNLIGAKFANDIVVTSHETGHKVDALVNLSAEPSISAELLNLGDNSRPGSMSSWTPSKTVKYRKGEGVAEFMRYWLTDPAEASRLAPNTTTFFESAISALPDVNKMLRQAREDIANWRSAEPQARLRSQISIGENQKTRYTLSDLTHDLVDDLHHLRLASDDAAALGTVLKPSENPYVMARLLRGQYGVADTFIKSGSINFKTREVTGPGLRQILEPVGARIADFRDYIVARQAREMHGQGKETGLLPADVDFVANKFSGDAKFNAAFDQLKAWSDSFITYAVDSGYLSPESAARMRAMNQEYVPFHRIFEVGAGELGAEGGASGRGLNQTKDTFKRRKGSRRDIVDPLETYVKNAYSVLLNADKNAVNIAIADMAQMKGMGKWVEPIATPKEMQRVGLEKIRDDLEANGADLTAVPDDLLLTFWKDSNRAPSGENIIKVNRAGKLEFYRLNADLYKTVQALDAESAGTLLKILSAPAQILRAGATLTPDFAVANAMRDTVSSSVVSRYGVFPVEATLKGLYSLLKNPKIVQEWKASGGAQSVEAHYFDRVAMQKFLKENVSKDFSVADYAKFVAKSPLTALRILSGTLEEATRIGEFQRVYDKLIKQGYDIGEARRLAAFESRDLQDFAMGGSKTKSLRRATAFWNAALQGNYRLYQNLKNPETRMATMAKATAWVTVPTVTLFAINMDDADYWDKPQWERDIFWLIPRGKDELGHTKFLRIPKPFEIGLIFGTVPERAMGFWFKQDPAAFKDLKKQIVTQTVPNPIPQALMSLFGAFISGERGYDAFRGRPIVPESMKDFPPELQFTEQTSLTAKRIGATLGFAPMKVDYLINQTGGGLAKQAVNQGADRVLSWMTGEERKARSTYPGARFIGLPSGVQSEAVEKFYDRLKTLRQEGERRKITGFGDDKFLDTAEDTARRLSAIRKRQLKLKDDTARQKLSLEMREIAERTLKRIDKK